METNCSFIAFQLAGLLGTLMSAAASA